MTTPNVEMQSFSARYNTFQITHHISKRRASSQSSKKKGAGNTIEWPHQSPPSEDVCCILTNYFNWDWLTVSYSSHALASTTDPHPTATTMSNASTAPSNSTGGNLRTTHSKNIWRTLAHVTGRSLSTPVLRRSNSKVSMMHRLLTR